MNRQKRAKSKVQSKNINKNWMKIIRKTKSLCPVCQRVIPAKIFEQNKRIFIQSFCPQHRETVSDHGWDDPEIYEGLRQIETVRGGASQVIVDVTKRCNLHCKICFAMARYQQDGAGPRTIRYGAGQANEFQEDSFRAEDIEELQDYKRVFISGGEPTLREDLPQIIRRCRKNGQKPILFTNGIKLSKPKYLKTLKKAGLGAVLLQLDTLNDAESQYIRGRKLTKIKLQALENLNDLNIPVSIWTVALKDRNLKELSDIHKEVLKYSCVKTVSAIPIWRVGRFSPEDYAPPSEIISELCRLYKVTRADFVSTTELVCNIDRLLSVFGRKNKRTFGLCMTKVLLMDYGGGFVPIGKIFSVRTINERIGKVMKSKRRLLSALKFTGFFFFDQILLNFFRNRYFRIFLGKFVSNLRHLKSGRFLMLTPLRFITVAIFPSPKNIDLDFIRSCNTYSLSSDDYSFRPACLYYMEQERKNEEQKIEKK